MIVISVQRRQWSVSALLYHKRYELVSALLYITQTILTGTSMSGTTTVPNVTSCIFFILFYFCLPTNIDYTFLSLMLSIISSTSASKQFRHCLFLPRLLGLQERVVSKLVYKLHICPAFQKGTNTVNVAFLGCVM